MNKETKNIVIFLTTCIILIIILSYFNYVIKPNKKDILCKNINESEYIHKNGQSYCKSINGDLNYVELFNCGFWELNCEIRKIKIGRVYIK